MFQKSVKSVYLLFDDNSEEIIRSSLLVNLVALSGSRLVLDVCLLEVLIDIHDGGHVVASVAVVGG